MFFTNFGINYGKTKVNTLRSSTLKKWRPQVPGNAKTVIVVPIVRIVIVPVSYVVVVIVVVVPSRGLGTPQHASGRLTHQR